MNKKYKNKNKKTLGGLYQNPMNVKYKSLENSNLMTCYTIRKEKERTLEKNKAICLKQMKKIHVEYSCFLYMYVALKTKISWVSSLPKRKLKWNEIFF